MGDYAVHREVTEGREGVKKEREESRPGESHKGKILIFIFHGREGGVRIGRCGTSPGELSPVFEVYSESLKRLIQCKGQN